MFHLFNKTPQYDFSGKYSAQDIAKYVVARCTRDKIPVTNLQLQKILYYLQLFFLQNKHYALFKDEIEAWQFGPVVRNVYREYCGYGASSIYESQEPTIEFTEDELLIMNDIIMTKRAIKPWDLVKESHQVGKPWDLTYRDGLGDKAIIRKDVIAAYG